MLITPRIPTLAALGATLTIAVGLAVPSAPPAKAAPPALAFASQVTMPGGTGIPAGAGAQISAELASAWRITKGSGVIVAVLDTGVAAVGGLAGKVTTGPDYAPVPSPVLTDGTVLAALIAGSGTSRSATSGPVGRAPDARILSIRIVAYGSGLRTALRYQQDGVWQQIEAKAIRYAADHGAKVIVCAESGAKSSAALASAVAYAIQRNAVVITADFSFSKGNGVQYPDGLPGVINVSGTVVHGLPMTAIPGHFAGNSSVLVTAPANDLFGTGPGNHVYIGYNNDSAIAWAAGTVALIKSVYPRIPPALVARALAVSASYHPAGGYNTQIGFGLINPIGALRAAGQLMKLRTAAAPGPAIASPGSHFGQAGATGATSAAPRSGVKLVGYSVAVAAGLALLAFAYSLRKRDRRRKQAIAPASAAGASPAPTWTTDAATAAAQPVAGENQQGTPEPGPPAAKLSPRPSPP